VIEIRVDDPADPRLADYIGLRDPARRSRVEADGGFFVAEGLYVIERLLGSNLNVRSVFVTPARLERLRASLEGRPVTVFVAASEVMERVVGFDIHRGALASAQRPAPVALEDAVAGASLVVALEGLNDHENLGVILRSAVGLGADAVMLDPRCADPWYRRSVRVSMGAVFDLPVVRVDSMVGSLRRLQADGLRVVAMALSDGAVPLGEVPVGEPTVVVLGAEGPGLAHATIDAADVVAVIPMRRGIDSLNVGHAAAIAIHHMRPDE
jgi:tRNA G18 (ribose-2'-O)-methylase SpoU